MNDHETKTKRNISAKTKSEDPWEHFTKPIISSKRATSKWLAKASSLHRHQPSPGLEGPELVVRLICAEDVLALDRMTGTSDPIAFMFCGRESYLSEVKKGTVNPYWNAEFRFGGKRQDIRTVNELHVQIKDENSPSKSGSATSTSSRHRKVASTGDSIYKNLGGVVVDLQQVRSMSSQWSKPKWYALKTLKGMATVSGRVRLSLRYFSMPDSVASSGCHKSISANDSLDKLMKIREASVPTTADAGNMSTPPLNPEEAENLSTVRKRSGSRSASRRGKIVRDLSEQKSNAGVNGRLMYDMHVLSSFRSKAQAELKSMAKKIEQQSEELKKAQQMVKEAQENARIKQGQCEERGAKIAELAHTIEMLQVHGGSTTTVVNMSNQRLTRRQLLQQQRRHQQQKDNSRCTHREVAHFLPPPPPLPPPLPPSSQPPPSRLSRVSECQQLVHDHPGVSSDHHRQDLGLCFDGEHEFSVIVSQSLHRLRDASTRTAAKEELRNIADGLTSAKSRVVWRCLRVAESDTDINFQRECAATFGTLAQQAPRACAGTLALALDSICRRILSGNDSRKNEALVQSTSTFSLQVFPIVLAGKVQPSLMPMMRPFLDVVRRYPHAQAGAVAAQCIGAMILPAQPRITVERFQIFGIDMHHNSSESVLRRMLTSSIPTLPCPAKVSANEHEGAMNIDVPAEDAVRFYDELLKNLHYLPDKWIVAASGICSTHGSITQPEMRGGRRRVKKMDSHKVVTKSREMKNQHHMRLVAACAGELLHVSAPLIQLFCDSQGMVRVALFDVIGKLCDIASSGLANRENRIARAIVTAGSTILQQCLDTLLLENRSFIWKQRRAALHCIRNLADLDGAIHVASVNRVMRRSLPTVFDASVDMKIILDAVAFAKHDKVNVVRAAAVAAIRGLDQIQSRKNGKEIEEPTRMPSAVRSREGTLEKALPSSVQTVVNNVCDWEEEDEETQDKVQHQKSRSAQQNQRTSGASLKFPVYIGRRTETTASQAAVSKIKTNEPSQADSIPGSFQPQQYRPSSNYTSSEIDSQNEVESEANIEMSNLIGQLSGADVIALDSKLQLCAADGAEALCDVLDEYLSSQTDADAVDLTFVKYIIVELVDDGQMVAAAFGMLSRKLARRCLEVIADVLSILTSQPQEPMIDVALSRVLRWVYAAINSNHWCALDIVQGIGEWHSVRNAVQRLSSKTSEFSRKVHAAKIFALLRSVMLLDAHLAIFAVRPSTYSDEESEEEEEGEDLEKKEKCSEDEDLKRWQ